MVEAAILPTSALIQSEIILPLKSWGLENLFQRFQKVNTQGRRDLWAEMPTRSQATAPHS